MFIVTHAKYNTLFTDLGHITCQKCTYSCTSAVYEAHNISFSRGIPELFVHSVWVFVCVCGCERANVLNIPIKSCCLE